MFIYRVWRKSFELVFDHRFRHLRFVLPHLWFFVFCQNLDILSIHLSDTVSVYKIWYFYFYQFWTYKQLNIPHTITHTHITYAQSNFQNPIFWVQGTSKHINQVKNRHWKFWPKTILPLPYGRRVMEVKIIADVFYEI